MRLFVAIPVPEHVKKYAFRIRGQLAKAEPKVKWVEYENYHITLKFLGEVKPELLTEIRDKLNNAARGINHFDLELSDLTCFPNLKRPRVLIMEIGGATAESMELGKRIDKELQELGFEPEHRRHFHLTLGRLRSEVDFQYFLPWFNIFKPNQDIPGFKVKEFQLMESELSRFGPKYRILETIKL